MTLARKSVFAAMLSSVALHFLSRDKVHVPRQRRMEDILLGLCNERLSAEA